MKTIQTDRREFREDKTILTTTPEYSEGKYTYSTPEISIGLEAPRETHLDPYEFEYQFFTRSGYPIRFYSDDSGSPFWYVCNEYSVTSIIQARTESDAWECHLDEFACRVAPEDLHDAYIDPDTDDCFTKEKFESFDWESCHETGDYPELVQGYEHQPNSTGTGIVSVSDNEYPFPLTIEAMERLEINMVIVQK